jgi:hypothetical protein
MPFVYIIHTQTPINSRDCKNWNPPHDPKFDRLLIGRGLNNKDQWWWGCSSLLKAKQAKLFIKEKNSKTSMRLYIKRINIKDLPPTAS